MEGVLGTLSSVYRAVSVGRFAVKGVNWLKKKTKGLDEYKEGLTDEDKKGTDLEKEDTKETEKASDGKMVDKAGALIAGGTSGVAASLKSKLASKVEKTAVGHGAMTMKSAVSSAKDRSDEKKALNAKIEANHKETVPDPNKTLGERITEQKEKLDRDAELEKNFGHLTKGGQQSEDQFSK